MSILDFFKAPPADNKAGNSNTNTNTNTNTNAANSNGNLSDSNPATNSNNQMPGTNQEPANPLDVYGKMFDNAAKNSEIQAPSFKLDSKVVDEVASKMNFTQGLDPQVVQKAMQGDPEAFMATLQAATQNAYKAAIQHNTSLTDTFINQRSEYEQKRLQTGVHKELTNQALSTAPNFSHPVIKQELNRVAEQFSRANPDASPVEIAEAAKKYITDLSSALNPAAPTDKAQKEDMDWSKYLS